MLTLHLRAEVNAVIAMVHKMRLEHTFIKCHISNTCNGEMINKYSALNTKPSLWGGASLPYQVLHMGMPNN